MFNVTCLPKAIAVTLTVNCLPIIYLCNLTIQNTISEKMLLSPQMPIMEPTLKCPVCQVHLVMWLSIDL